MNLYGILMIILSWGIVTCMVICCFRRVLGNEDPGRNIPGRR
jgi:hypothetical protein